KQSFSLDFLERGTFTEYPAVVFIFIVMFSLLFMQDSDFVWKTFLLLGFIKRWMVDRFEYESPFGQKKNADRRMFLRHRRFLVVRCEVGL
ncbi:hypothetical protein, partial [Bacteroides ovatus]